MTRTTPILDLAMSVALGAHNGQTNKHNGEPYILHVHRVASHVRDRGLDETHQAVAWLHDVLEDTDFTVYDLNSMFNPQIIAAVSAITKVKGASNEDYYRNLTRNEIAARVKVSDMIDNFSRNHTVTDDATRLRLAAKYSLGFDILKDFV
jgi:(p)ppGpp synthase/HD superfamily hydrolase